MSSYSMTNGPQVTYTEEQLAFSEVPGLEKLVNAMQDEFNVENIPDNTSLMGDLSNKHMPGAFAKGKIQFGSDGCTVLLVKLPDGRCISYQLTAFWQVVDPAGAELF